jgi:hypothetical protein
MAFDYTNWPVAGDVTTMLASANITPGAGITSDIETLAINSAVTKFVQKTGREFLPTSAGTIRYYDGSGTGKMIIDDYISLTAIEFFQIPSSGTVSITNWLEVQNVPYAKNEVQILQGPANMAIGWWTYFPQGRGNIKITGTFGYGTSIPAAVWEAVLGQAAANLADRIRMTSNGILTDLHDMDEDFKWSEKQIGILTGWRENYSQAINDWKKPLRQVMQRHKVVLI